MSGASRVAHLYQEGSTRVVATARCADEAYIEALVECGGYYHAPSDPATSELLGPLVGYSGRYVDDIDGEEKQYVGFGYYNFATLEQYPQVADFFASGLAAEVSRADLAIDCIVGVPDGGSIIGHNTARHLGVMFAGLQKKIVALATSSSKEQTRLSLGRHEIMAEMHVALCEDLVNNFSTTDKAIAVVEATGAKVVGIICGFNRSEKTEYGDRPLPVVALLHRPTPQYRQDNPAVAPHIENPGVVWDVKPNWVRLKKAMADAQARGISI